MLKSMTKTYWILSLLFVCGGCSNALITGDRRLLQKEIPPFMAEYQKPQYESAEFFEKSSQKHKSYEVKYLKNGQEVSLAFDRSGRLIEREEDTHLEALPDNVRIKILQYMTDKYPGHVILEVEKRQENQTQDFIDVEIRHKSSKSGYWELTFTPDGEYVSREVEDYQMLETLN